MRGGPRETVCRCEKCLKKLDKVDAHYIKSVKNSPTDWGMSVRKRMTIKLCEKCIGHAEVALMLWLEAEQ